jgi:hypothetical protein
MEVRRNETAKRLPFPKFSHNSRQNKTKHEGEKIKCRNSIFGVTLDTSAVQMLRNNCFFGEEHAMNFGKAEGEKLYYQSSDILIGCAMRRSVV